MTSNTAVRELDLSAQVSRRAMLGRPGLLLAAVVPGILPARLAAGSHESHAGR